jgi:hypothetical protein
MGAIMAVRDLVDPGGLRDINSKCLAIKMPTIENTNYYAIANQIFSHMFLGRGGG